MSGRTFTFIDNAAIDVEPRKTIRSQVMKGRHVGRVHKARGRQALNQANTSNADAQMVLHRENTARAARNSSLKLPMQVGNELLGVSHHSEITPEAKRYAYTFLHTVVQGLYPPEICYASNLSDMVWFMYLFQDEAYFHSFVALSQIAVEFAQGRKPGTSRHLVKALRLTNDNLSGARALSDTTIASVISLCYISMICQSPSQTKIHFDGLVHLIQARGGLRQLHSNYYLVTKAQNIDLVLALQLGCAPYLNQMITPLEAISSFFSNPSFVVSSPLVNAVRHVNEELSKVAVDVLKVSHMFNSRTTTTKLGSDEFQQILITVRYHLLCINTLGGSQLTDPVAIAVHLGLTAFMTLFGTHFGHKGRVRFKLFFDVMQAALANHHLYVSVDLGTHLWLLTMTSISIADDDGRAWLAPRIKAIVSRLGRCDWDFAWQILKAYPWVGLVHDPPASELWASIFGPTCVDAQLSGFGPERLQTVH